jgi:hypothetical protein
MYLLFRWVLPPFFFLYDLFSTIKHKLFYWGMPKEPDPVWEFYEGRSPEEKFPKLVNQKKKFYFTKGGIPNIIFNLLQEEHGDWVSIQRLINATGKDSYYIRITISQIKKRIKPYTIEPSGKGSYRLIIS